MLPDYSHFKGQAISLPALLELIDTSLTAPEMQRVLGWMGRWDLLWIGTNDAEEAVIDPDDLQERIENLERYVTKAVPSIDPMRFDRFWAEMERALKLSNPQRVEVKLNDVPLSPGGCPAARELAEGAAASDGQGGSSPAAVEGGGVIPSPPPVPEDDDGDGAWPIEDEQDPAAPPPPIAAEKAPEPAGQGATPAEVAPEAAPAGELKTGPWSAEEDAEVMRLKGLGKTVREIAALIGRSYDPTRVRIYSKLMKKPKMPGGERGGLQQHRQADDAPVQGATAGDVPQPVAPEAAPPRAAPASFPAWWDGTVKLYASIGRKGGWTPARDLVLVDGRRKEVPWPVIADELGCEGRDARARFIALTPDGESPKQLEQLAEVLKALAAQEGGGK